MRLAWWFVIGFAASFLGMLFFWPTHIYDGRVVMQSVLWRSYVFEIDWALNNDGLIGPVSGGWDVVFRMAGLSGPDRRERPSRWLLPFGVVTFVVGMILLVVAARSGG